MVRFSQAPVRRRILSFHALALVLFAGIALSPAAVWAHGGKQHGENEFTAFLALREGAKLYDKLIVSGKLPGEWETDLVRAEISTRKDGREYVVSFHREPGDPAAVYFFFTAKGEYAGSNFTGE
jgi:hypothetical protein